MNPYRTSPLSVTDVAELLAGAGVGEHTYHLLVIPEDRTTLDVTQMAGCVAERRGIRPESVVLGSYADIERTSSGKPLREGTLRALTRAGRVHPRASDTVASAT